MNTYNGFGYPCPKCKKETEFIYYDGCLGYESYTCSKCGTDINDIYQFRIKADW